jgi:two-component system, NarL family, invasion response regulator UvrY
VTGLVRVLVVDDQAHFRRVASSLISAVGGFEVVGEAATGEEALALAASVEAELVLMDVRMPGIGGIEATRRILAGRPATRVVLVSSADATDLPAGLTTCGAERFIRKDAIDVATFKDLRSPNFP